MPKIKVSLRELDRKELQMARRKRDSNMGERAYYVLLADEGKSAPEIAAITQRHEHTIRLWLKAYLRLGIEGLKDTKPPGRKAIKSIFIKAKLDKLLQTTPQAYGYQESLWHVNVLRDYFAKQGMGIGETWMKTILKGRGYVYKRSSQTIPKHAPSKEEKVARVKEIVAAISADKRSSETLFLDESHFSNRPYVERGWFRRGEKNSRNSQSTRA